MSGYHSHRQASRLLLGVAVVGGLATLAAIVWPTPAWALQPTHTAKLGAETVRPSADGTLVDGGIYGPFDSVPDDWDWTFDDSGYEGAITLVTETPESSLERRVVWEYDLAEVSSAPPVTARVSFTMRGAPVFPMPDTEVHVYSFPADLEELPEDFGAGPATFVGSVTIAPYQDPTAYELDLSDAVNQALESGADRVAIRFQVNPATPHTKNQAFIDALDGEPSTKPYLTIWPWQAEPVWSNDPRTPEDAPVP